MSGVDIIESSWDIYLATTARPSQTLKALSASIASLTVTAKALQALIDNTSTPITEIAMVNAILSETASLQNAFAQVGEAIEGLRALDRQTVAKAAVIDQQRLIGQSKQNQQVDANLVSGLDTGVGSIVSAANALLIGETGS